LHHKAKNGIVNLNIQVELLFKKALIMRLKTLKKKKQQTFDSFRNNCTGRIDTLYNNDVI